MNCLCFARPSDPRLRELSRPPSRLGGHRSAALEQLWETHRKAPDFKLGRLYLGRSLFKGGTVEEREQALGLLRGFQHGFPYGYGDLGWALALTGEMEAARTELVELSSRVDKGEYIPNVAFARIHVGLGQADEAIDYLQRAVDEKETCLPLLLAEGHFESLVNTERFDHILEQVDLKR